MSQSRQFFRWKPTDGISCVPVSIPLHRKLATIFARGLHFSQKMPNSCLKKNLRGPYVVPSCFTFRRIKNGLLHRGYNKNQQLKVDKNHFQILPVLYIFVCIGHLKS